MQHDQDREETMKEWGGASRYCGHTMENPVKAPECPTGKTEKAWETRETAGIDAVPPVSSALRREYNSHSTRTGGKIVQQIDATAKLPHNYDVAACAAVLHGNFAADLSVVRI
jgi:hypothetical protein